MKLPRNLSGRRLAEQLCSKRDYRLVHQVGSHLILETKVPTPHRIAISAHGALRVGTLNSILRSVAQHRGIAKEDLLADFD